MNKSSIMLFYLRLFFYLSIILMIFIHPGIAVSFDQIGIMQWLIIIPVMALIAFYLPIVKNRRIMYFFSFILLFFLSIIAGRSFIIAFWPFIAGIICFSLTFILFHNPRYGKIAALEPFFLVWVALRLLSLSRSGEDIAGQSILLTQFILVWTAVVFLSHSAVIYFCLYPKSRSKVKKEIFVFSLSALAILFLVIVILPPDFVRNTIINNLFNDRVPELIKPSDNDRGIPTRGSGRRTLPRGNEGRSNLRGIPEHNWPGRGGGDSDENRQYMVKIVVSETEPVYMGHVFRGQLDPVEGFLLSSEEQINNLIRQRFFVTWFGSAWEPDYGRERREVLSLSTLQQKYLPWRPIIVDPLILSDNTGPLRYIHQVVSNMHHGDPLELVRIPSRPFSEREKQSLAHYLEIPLFDNDKREFTTFMNSALHSWQEDRDRIIRSDRYLQEIFSGEITGSNEHLEKIIALLVSFRSFQYNLNPDDEYSIASLKHFLFNSAEGDCVEFSNTLALLGRLAGIPSRVVTGYLAAEGLQTMAHLRGLASLREKIPFLQQFAFDNLFMVTNIHSHSWTQFYIPDYGWLDFEATMFSIPPVDMGDFNNWDVVIPILEGERTFSQVRKIPWRAIGRVVITLIIFSIILAYALRYGRELVLYIRSKSGSRQGARSLYLLLLARLAADGKPIKPASKTAHEYIELFKVTENKKQKNLFSKEELLHLKAFADIYSEIRWREFDDPTEMERRFQLLYNEYTNVLSARKRGLLPFLFRSINLRGLAYL